MRKRKLNKKNIAKLIIGILVIVLIIASGCFIVSTRKKLVFEKDLTVEINSEDFDPLNYISKIKDQGSIEQVSYDDSQLDLSKTGEYEVIYTYEGKEYKETFEVVDTTAPIVQVKDYTMTVGDSVTAKNLIESIDDASETTVKFKKKYKFKKPGEYHATVVVTDSSDNTTEKEVKITVLEKDTEAPKISGVKDIVTYVGSDENFKNGVTVTDNRDEKVELKIDSSFVDLSKKGKYTIIYSATDQAGNTTSKTCSVTVKSKPKLDSSQASKNKVVYLTFDDGPSSNTKKILKILKKYKVKATFFVTAQNEEYLDLLKDEYDAGHTVAIHSYTHDFSIYSSEDDYYADLEKMQEVIKEKTGAESKYVRFPGGSSNTISRNYKSGIMTDLSYSLVLNGYQYYDWNVDSGDASGNHVSAKKLLKNIKKAKLYKNCMVLMHDTDAKSTTVKALPKIIKYYKKKGYTFKAIDDDSFICHHHINN